MEPKDEIATTEALFREAVASGHAAHRDVELLQRFYGFGGYEEKTLEAIAADMGVVHPDPDTLKAAMRIMRDEALRRVNTWNPKRPVALRRTDAS